MGTPAPESLPMSVNAGFDTNSAFTGSAIPALPSTTLIAPITITYAGNSPTILINDSGTSRGVMANLTNAHNSTSALFGQTNGSGAGLTGYNSGTVGPGGKFGVTNSNSSQPGAFATTNGMGPALVGTITKVNSSEPAILGQNLGTPFYGTGLEGEGNEYGVYGTANYAGVYGYGATLGVVGESDSGTGLTGTSSSGFGAYIKSESGIGVYGYSFNNYGLSAESYGGSALSAVADGSGTGVMARSYSGFAVHAVSSSGFAIVGESTSNYAVVGEDFGSGVGVYGYSASGYAGAFEGKVTATSYETSSDRNVKTKIHAIDSKAILDKVARLPVSSWAFKTDPNRSHVGPMAQDFHAAFGLDGDDDKHINLTDIAGVSLASIQELSKQMQRKDAEIAELKQLLSQMQASNERVSARTTALEQQRVRVTNQTASLKHL